MYKPLQSVKSFVLSNAVFKAIFFSFCQTQEQNPFLEYLTNAIYSAANLY